MANLQVDNLFHSFFEIFKQGYARSFKNLTSVIVRNAGHEVPFFQPENSLDLFNRFIFGKPFF
jgi:carboxypeptidase C (cathepsin A)